MVLAAFGLSEGTFTKSSVPKPTIVMTTTVKTPVPTPVKVPMPTAVPTPIVQDTTPGDYVVIGSFARRDQVVTIKSGSGGIVYTIAGKDGRILFDNLTAAQLKEKTPQLHDYISTGTGQIWGGLLKPEKIDAGMREAR